MPYYEYRCPDCSIQFEMLRSVDQRDELVECPQCQRSKCTRMLSIPMMFLQTADGQMQAVAGTSSGCSGCTASSCGNCGSN
jgi:putative FmdB family regulatory protein